MSAYSEALEQGKFYVGGVCTDCMVTLVNGDYSGNSDDWDVDEFDRITREYDINPGHPHNLPEWFTECAHAGAPCPDDADCDCAERGFGTSRCETCGTFLHGDRHEFTFIARRDLEN
jgi:hypothetical protein